MVTAQHRRAALALACALTIAGFHAACAAKQTPAAVAHHGADAVAAVRKLQQWTTSNVEAGGLPRNVGDKITDINQELHDAGQAVLSGLRALDTATTTTLRNVEAAKLDALLSTFNTAIAKARNASGLPAPLIGEFSSLVGNVSKTYDEILRALGK